MGVLDQIFGTSLPLPVRFLLAFVIVLGLIALVAWVIRRLAGRRLPVATASRARQPRLGVLDAFAIDARRRLVLIRRDNVEHLIMIGGPNDVVIESNIVRVGAQAAPGAEPRARIPEIEAAPRPQMAPPSAAPRLDHAAGEPPARPAPAAPPRPAPQIRPPVRPAAPAPAARPAPPPPSSAPAVHAPHPADEDLAPPPAPQPAPRESKLPGFFRSSMARPGGQTPPAAPSAPPTRTEPPLRAPEPARPASPPPAAPAPAARTPDVDPLFADIEKQLEEALHRPATPPARPVAPPRPAAPPPPPRRPLPERPAAAERPAPVAPTPRPAAPPAQPQPARQNPMNEQAHLDALEEEMANLLGRDRQS
ncbi:flagellar biosynthetic protein FliO [Terrihabitans sp. B22-R8]|uniref:flagellar biosynthetic protein FliO n=1 Tax=Terrihabitans sp. B22-R8 TaxID=3425128 RepID=UPI00403D21F2